MSCLMNGLPVMGRVHGEDGGAEKGGPGARSGEVGRGPGVCACGFTVEWDWAVDGRVGGVFTLRKEWTR